MLMRRSILILASALILSMPGLAGAGDKAVVVELYTSQGCSSCPPADELMGEIAKMDDVIALSLHVDYWDYIGWKDIFADPKYSVRQKRYAHAAGARSVYTPQMVIGGVDHVVGYKPMDVASTIQKHRGVAYHVAVTAERAGDWIRIAASAAREQPMQVHLVGLNEGEAVKIKRGENAGKTLHYHNTVREWVTLRDWDGSGKYTIKHKAPEGDHAVVIVQEANHGPIVGATKVR